MKDVSTADAGETPEEDEYLTNLDGLTPEELERYRAQEKLFTKAGTEGMKQVREQQAELRRRGLLDAEGKLIQSNYV